MLAAALQMPTSAKPLSAAQDPELKVEHQRAGMALLLGYQRLVAWPADLAKWCAYSSGPSALPRRGRLQTRRSLEAQHLLLSQARGARGAATTHTRDTQTHTSVHAHVCAGRRCFHLGVYQPVFIGSNPPQQLHGIEITHHLKPDCEHSS